jgi:hypothetical protein
LPLDISERCQSDQMGLTRNRVNTRVFCGFEPSAAKLHEERRRGSVAGGHPIHSANFAYEKQLTDTGRAQLLGCEPDLFAHGLDA